MAAASLSLINTLTHPLIWGSIITLYTLRTLYRKARQRRRINTPPRHKVHDLRLPFDGEWHTYWGGDTPALNHHFESNTQRYALDFVIPCPSLQPRSEMTTEPLTFKGEGKTNEDYFCFGAPILAPHSGLVTCAVDGIEDNPLPGIGNPAMTYGNTIMLQHPASGFISVLAHLKKGTLLVREGEHVIAGQPIAQCGNSGNSSEPHLHYHIQTHPGFEQGTGVKAHFAAVQINGTTPEFNYAPLKGNRIAPVEDEALAPITALAPPRGR